MSLLFHYFFRFSPETNHFVPISILLALLEYSLHIYYFSSFFLKSRCQVSHYTRRLEIHKVFQLYQNLTKFDRIARFRETNLTA